MDHLNRKQAIGIVGEAAVRQVEAMRCEPTGRVLPLWDETVEYRASLACSVVSGSDRFDRGAKVILEALYYPYKSEFFDRDGKPIADLGNIDWVIHHYNIK